MPTITLKTPDVRCTWKGLQTALRKSLTLWWNVGTKKKLGDRASTKSTCSFSRKIWGITQMNADKPRWILWILYHTQQQSIRNESYKTLFYEYDFWYAILNTIKSRKEDALWLAYHYAIQMETKLLKIDVLMLSSQAAKWIPTFHLNFIKRIIDRNNLFTEIKPITSNFRVNLESNHSN